MSSTLQTRRTVNESTSQTGEAAGEGMGGVSWRDRVHVAGAVLIVVALVDSLAVAFYEATVLRTSGGTGTVGQITLSGIYSLIVLAGVLLLSMPAQSTCMSARGRRAFLILAMATVAFVAVTQVVEAYAVLAQPGTSTPATAAERGFILFSPLADLTMTLLAGWLAALGFRSASASVGGSSTAPMNPLGAAALAGVVLAIVVQFAAASATAPGPSTTSPPAPTQLPLPVGQVSTAQRA